MQTSRYAQPGKQQGDINSRDTEAIRDLRDCQAPNYSMCSPKSISQHQPQLGASQKYRICIFKKTFEFFTWPLKTGNSWFRTIPSPNQNSEVLPQSLSDKVVGLVFFAQQNVSDSTKIIMDNIDQWLCVRNYSNCFISNSYNNYISVPLSQIKNKI